MQPREVLVAGEKLAWPLAPLTSWRIGGNAERFFSPLSVENLSAYLNKLPLEMPITWLGLGSNVLIRDQGIAGAVIGTRQLQQLFQQGDLITAQAGVTCAKFARFACRLGFPDAGFFAGIPGTIGGALAMNAGAFGGETWEWVQSVTVINRRGELIRKEPRDYLIGLRMVKSLAFTTVQNTEQNVEAFVSAEFCFPKRNDIDGMKKIRELLRKRADLQPIGTLNCGSVYVNPSGDYAGRLIEACELKGVRIGDAMISSKHANFIINCGVARAEEIEKLMKIIETAVLDRFGIQLHAEVKILGQKEK